MAADGTKQLSHLTFYSWSVVIGAIAALSEWVFQGLIAVSHNLFLLGRWSWKYDNNEHMAPSPWGPFVMLVPVLGAVPVALLIKYFAPEAKGHGVPEVLDAIYYNKGVIRPIVGVIKSVASALSIGTGGSVGREGPIVQTSATFGSALGQILPIPNWQRVTMIAAGGGAGIAATFNTPIGGVLFAVEIMLHEVSARTLVPVTIATVTATYLGRLLFGSVPAFAIPALESPLFEVTDVYMLPLYALLGVIMGLASLAYIWTLYACEDFFEKWVKGAVFRHMVGMAVVGVLMYVMLVTSGHYYIQGVGYATIRDILSGAQTWPLLLLLLYLLKLLVTSLTLGSGASGGVFSPGLFMGATLGAAFGLLVPMILPLPPVQAAGFAMAGMAGVIGGSTGAALTAIVMIFEMTRDFSVVIPMTIVVALSYGVRKMLHAPSIYTEKLVRRGHDVPDTLQANFYHLKKTRDVMDTHFVTVPAAGTMADLARAAKANLEAWYFIVLGPEGIVGVIVRDALVAAFARTRADELAGPPFGQDGYAPSQQPPKLQDLADRKFIAVGDHVPLLEVMTRLRSAGACTALVTDASGKNVRGLITKQQIAGAVLEDMELFSE